MERSNTQEINNQINNQTNGETMNPGSELVPVKSVTADGEYTSDLLQIPTTIETQQYQSFLQLAQQLPNMTPTISISSKYFEFTKPGETIRGIYLGNTWIQCKNNDGELRPLEAVSWLDQDGTMWINSGATLISAFRQFSPPKGCPVEIVFEGKKDRTKLYNVRILVA